MRMVLCLILQVLAGAGFRLFSGKATRLAYSTVVGVSLQLFMYRSEMISFYFVSVVSYGIVRFLRNNKHMPFINFIWCMGLLSCCHIYIMFMGKDTRADNSTLFLMPLVLRLSSIGYILRDGDSKGEKELTER